MERFCLVLFGIYFCFCCLRKFCTIRGAWFSLLICIMKFMLCPFCWWEVKDYSSACLLFVGRCSVGIRWFRLWCLRCEKRWLWGFQYISMKVILWILCLFLCSLLFLFFWISWFRFVEIVLHVLWWFFAWNCFWSGGLVLPMICFKCVVL